MYGSYWQKKNCLYIIVGYGERWEKNLKEKVKIEQNKHPFCYLPIPPPTVFKMEVGCFPVPREPKPNQTFPLVGKGD